MLISKFCFLSSFASHQPPFPSCSVIPLLYLVLPNPPPFTISHLPPPYYLTLTFFLCLFLLVLMRIWTPNLWICSTLPYPLDHTSNRWNSPYNSQPYDLLVPDSPWPKIIIYSHKRMTDQHVQVNFGWFSTRKTYRVLPKWWWKWIVA